jgi:two-component sensor histidine kinase
VFAGIKACSIGKMNFMKKPLVRPFFFFLIHCLLYCCLPNSTFAQELELLKTELAKTKADTSRVITLIKLGKYFEGYAASSPNNTDTAHYYLNSAIALSKKIGSVDLHYQALSEKAQTYILQTNFKSADTLFVQITDYYHKKKNYQKEADYWTIYGNVLPHDDPRVLLTRSKSFNKAYELYKLGNDRLKIADGIGKVADADLNMGKYDKAEKELLIAISEYKAIKFPRIYYGYYMLSEVYSRKGQPQKELLTKIECMKACDADSNRSDADALFFSISVGVSYQENNKFPQAIPYFKKGIELSFKLNDQNRYYLSIYGIIGSCIALKKYNAALSYLSNVPKKFAKKTLTQESQCLAKKMQLFNFLGRNKEAGTLIPMFKKVFGEMYQTLAADNFYYAVDKFIKSYDPLPQHYIQTKQWSKLAEELKFLQALPFKTKNFSAPSRILFFSYKYKLDSAAGNLSEALKGFQLIKRMQDSLNNAATTKQINEMEANYNSVKKDRTIQSLNNNALIQKERLEKVNRERNIILAIVLGAMTFVVVIFFAYRGKQRSNVRLQKKQEEINTQNSRLSALLGEMERLLGDKDSLLKRQEDLLLEKEWLLREIHHRVKNNLQIVMSLLYTQSAYLQNTDAIEAIKDSQNRVQAISIIHQKLYNKSNVATIVMADYINDLVRYLKTCYDCSRRKIKFREELDVVNLDISQAVPMGLILNEAITNCIKYAFDDGGGDIVIQALLSAPETILLSVSDNGRGLSSNFNLSETSSLGMEMMKALSKQLGGSFQIKSNQGVLVGVEFKIEHTSLKSG